MKQGWHINKLGDLYPLKTGKTPSRGDASLWDTKKATNNLWVSIADISANEGKAITDTKEYISDKACDKFPMVPEGTLLVSFKLSLGRMSFVGKALRTNEAILSLSPISEINQRFLYYYFLFFDWDKAAEGDVKVKGKTLNQKKLAEIPILYPSISEQQRIVSLLDAEFAKVDALKANAEKNLQNAKDLFQAVLKKELEPKEGWSATAISNISKSSENIKWKNVDASEKFKYIDLTSVDRSSHSIVDPQIITSQNAPSRAQRIVKTNDVIFATTRPTLKRLCIISKEYDGNICSTGFCVIRPHLSVLPKWIYYNLSTEEFYDYVEPLQTGATYPAITDNDIRNYTIYLPSIEDQQSIVARLDTLNEKCKTLQANYEKTLTLCDDLKQALLRKAFIGEI